MTNSLDYYGNETITTVKRFMIQTPGSFLLATNSYHNRLLVSVIMLSVVGPKVKMSVKLMTLSIDNLKLSNFLGASSLTLNHH